MALGSAQILINVSLPHLRRELAKAKKVFESSTVNLGGGLEKKGKKAGKKFAEGLEKGVKKEKARIQRAGRITAQSLIESLVTKLSGGKAAVAGAVIAIGVAALKGLDAFFETERKLVRIDAAFKSTGDVVGLTAGQVEAMAERMSRVSFLSKAQLLEASAITSSFSNIVGKNFEKTVKVVADLSVLMGTDTRTAALQLGKALSDPERGLSALRESGVVMTKEQEKMIITMFKAGDVAEAQNEIFKILAKNGIKDVSENTKNAVGNWEKFKNILLRVAEASGEVLQMGGLLGETFKSVGFILEGAIVNLRLTAGMLNLIGDSVRELSVPDPDVSAWDKYIAKIGEADEAIMALTASIATNTQKSSEGAKAATNTIQEQITALNELRAVQEKNQALAEFIASDIKSQNVLVNSIKARIATEKEGAKARQGESEERKVSAKIQLKEELNALDERTDANETAFEQERNQINDLIDLEQKKEVAGRGATFRAAEGGFAAATQGAIDAENKKEQLAKKNRLEALRGQLDQAQQSRDMLKGQAADEKKRIQENIAEKLRGIDEVSKEAEAASQKLLMKLGEALKIEIARVAEALKQLPFEFKQGTLAIAIEDLSKGFGQKIADELRSRVSVIGRTDRPDLGDAAFRTLQQNVNRAISTIRGTEKAIGVSEETIESRRVLSQLLFQAEQAKATRDATLLELKKTKDTEPEINISVTTGRSSVFSNN